MQKRILSFRPANFAKNVNEYDPTFDEEFWVKFPPLEFKNMNHMIIL
ncbi:MAG: hypothetical protein WBL67_07765 [Nitrososphaeraceae archaeon]